MRYIPNTKEQKEEMLKAIGVSSFEDLVANIPSSLPIFALMFPSESAMADLPGNILTMGRKPPAINVGE